MELIKVTTNSDGKQVVSVLLKENELIQISEESVSHIGCELINTLKNDKIKSLSLVLNCLNNNNNRLDILSMVPTGVQVKQYFGVTVFSNGSLISKSGRFTYGSKTNHGYMESYTEIGTIRVHRMVAESFIDNPKNYKYVNHKNGIKSDNRAENLEWCSASQNNQHAYDLGLKTPYWLNKKGPRVVNLHAKNTIYNWTKIFKNNNVEIREDSLIFSHEKYNNSNKKVKYFELSSVGKLLF